MSKVRREELYAFGRLRARWEGVAKTRHALVRACCFLIAGRTSGSPKFSYDMRKDVVGAALAAALMLAMWPSAGAGTTRGDRAACSQERTTRVVRSFVRAFNRGELERLDRLWAPEPEFQWYFVDDEREGDAENRATLLAYFARRIRLNDHLELREVSINRNGMDFGFRLRRTTDDERAGARGLFHGKGATRDVVTGPTISQPIPRTMCALVVWAMDT